MNPQESIPFQSITEDTRQPVKPWLQSSPNFVQQSPYVMQHDLTGINTYAAQPYNQYSRIMQNPGWNALQGLQEGSHQITSTLSNTMATISNFVQLVDTAVYSAWSSLTSLLALISQLSNFHQNYIRGGLSVAQQLLGKITRSLFSYSPGASLHGRRIAAIILGASIALAYLVKKALNEIIKIERVVEPARTISVLVHHSFEPQNSAQIALYPGETIKISLADKDTVGKYTWLNGWKTSGQSGYFPANYVKNLS